MKNKNKDICICGHSRKTHVGMSDNDRCCACWQKDDEIGTRMCECMKYQSRGVSGGRGGFSPESKNDTPLQNNPSPQTKHNETKDVHPSDVLMGEKSSLSRTNKTADEFSAQIEFLIEKNNQPSIIKLEGMKEALEAVVKKIDNFDFAQYSDMGMEAGNQQMLKDDFKKEITAWLEELK